MEVVLALGVVSFAIVPLMGLLAMGFTNYRSAGELNGEAVIVQSIRSQSAELTNVGQLLPATYFHLDGTETTAGNSGAAYKVTSTPATAAILSGTDSITLLNRYSIVRLASQHVTAEGVIHITPR